MTFPSHRHGGEAAPDQPPHLAPTRPVGDPRAPSGPAGRGPGRGNANTRPTSNACPGPEAALRQRAAALAQLVLEIETGRRSRRQLRPYMTPLLDARLAGVLVHTKTPATLGKVTGCRTAVDRYDAVALVRRGPRVTALTLGLRRHNGEWLLDDLGAPEEERLPPPAFPIADEPDAFDAVLEGRLVPRLTPR